jgi:arylsulfatase A-like enzyme
LPGRSLRALAESKAVKWRDFVVAESHYGRMVRTKQFKYCIYDSGSHREQLIDMLNDPGEMKNLSEVEKYKDVLEEHRRLLHDWVERIDDKIAAKYIIAGS